MSDDATPGPREAAPAPGPVRVHYTDDPLSVGPCMIVFMTQNTAPALHTLAREYLPDEIAEQWIRRLRPGPAPAPAPGEGYECRHNRGPVRRPTGASEGQAARRITQGGCCGMGAADGGPRPEWIGVPARQGYDKIGSVTFNLQGNAA
jgi:hypothetical protein